MKIEKPDTPFKDQNKIMEEALEINERVDNYFKNPRTKKDKSASAVAGEIIKEKRNPPINISRLPQEEKQWYKNMEDAGVRPLTDGYLEITRWDNTGEHFKKPVLIKQKVDDINSAIRMQDHILGQYRSEEKGQTSEFVQLESVEEVIENANQLLNKWRNAKPDERKDMQWQLADVVLQLENCRNEFKVIAKDQAAAVIELKDSQNRENPSAFAARTVAALNNLAKRISEMQLIMPLIALRKETLILEKRRAKSALRKSAGHLHGVINHSVFRDNTRKSPESKINDNEVDILDKEIGKTLYLLETIHIAPYLQQAEQAKFCILNKVKSFFRSKVKLINNLNPAKEALDDALKILEFDVESLE